MIWLATLATMACITCLAWLMHGWLGPAVRRYRQTYTEQASVRLGEVFLFIDPSQLWGTAICLASLAAAGAHLASGSPILAAVAALLASRLPGWHIARLRRQRLLRFQQQLPDTLLVLAAALKAGASVATAMRHIVEQAEAPLAQEFGLVLREQRLGVTFDTALTHLNMRVPAEGTALMVAALRISAQTGGNLAEALESIAHTLRAGLQLQARIRALTAQGRMQAWVMAALPLWLTGVLTQLEPQAMAVLWQSRLGWAVLFVVAVLEIAGVILIRRIVRIDV
jgi:tight adherence protein B